MTVNEALTGFYKELEPFRGQQIPAFRGVSAGYAPGERIISLESVRPSLREDAKPGPGFYFVSSALCCRAAFAVVSPRTTSRPFRRMPEEGFAPIDSRSSGDFRVTDSTIGEAKPNDFVGRQEIAKAERFDNRHFTSQNNIFQQIAL